MSNTMRWILAVLLIVLGLAAAAMAFFGGSFSTFACTTSVSDSIYYFLLFVSLIFLAAAVIPAVMLIRNAKGGRVIATLVIGIIVSCASYGLYLYFLGQSC